MTLLISYHLSYQVDNRLEDLLADPESFGDFEFLSYWQNYFNYFIGFAVFLAWIKVRIDGCWQTVVEIFFYVASFGQKFIARYVFI